MNKKWEYYEEKQKLIGNISKKFNISNLLAKILINRNIVDDYQIKVFLNLVNSFPEIKPFTYSDNSISSSAFCFGVLVIPFLSK